MHERNLSGMVEDGSYTGVGPSLRNAIGTPAWLTQVTSVKFVKNE